MTDIADRAILREQEFLDDLLLEQQIAAALDAPGNELCADCHEEIPEARRRAMPSAIRCVDCQAWVERLGPCSQRSIGS